MNEQTMGQLICKLRKEKGLTQKELASILNLTDKAVSKWERDIARPDVSIYPKLAEVLGVTTEELIAAKLSEKKTTNGGVELDSSICDTEIEIEESLPAESTPEYKKYIPHVVFQLFGVVLGVLLAVTESESFYEMLYELLGMSVVLVGLMRLAVCAFKSARIRLGRKLINEITLEAYIVPRNGLGVIIAFLTAFAALCILGFIVSSISTKSDVLSLIPILAFNVWALHSFILDLGAMTKKTPRGAKKSTRIAAIIIAAYLLLYIVSATAYYFYDKADKEGAPEQEIEVNAEMIKESPETLDALFEKVYIYSEEQEQEELEQGCEIIAPSKIHSAYFLSRIDDNGSYTKTNDAVIVISSYHIRNTGLFSFEREEWFVWAFPYFDLDDSGNLSYFVDGEYCDFLLADNYTEVYEWIETEYSGMEITQIYGDGE